MVCKALSWMPLASEATGLVPRQSGRGWKNTSMSNEELQGYCLKCKEKRIIQNPSPEWAANGSPGTRGKCPVCGGTIYKQGRTAAHDTLPKPAAAPRTTAKKTAPAKKAATKKATGGKKAAPSKHSGERGGKLVVVESPAKAKTIGRYLGRGYVVKPSLGHVRDLLKSRLSVDVENCLLYTSPSPRD